MIGTQIEQGGKNGPPTLSFSHVLPKYKLKTSCLNLFFFFTTIRCHSNTITAFLQFKWCHPDPTTSLQKPHVYWTSTRKGLVYVSIFISQKESIIQWNWTNRHELMKAVHWPLIHRPRISFHVEMYNPWIPSIIINVIIDEHSLKLWQSKIISNAY